LAFISLKKYNLHENEKEGKNPKKKYQETKKI